MNLRAQNLPSAKGYDIISNYWIFAYTWSNGRPLAANTNSLKFRPCPADIGFIIWYPTSLTNTALKLKLYIYQVLIVISATSLPALVNMSPPAANFWRISGIQGEKWKRAEGSEQQDREFNPLIIDFGDGPIEGYMRPYPIDFLWNSLTYRQEYNLV